MKEKMKKLGLYLFYKEKDEVLQKIQELGVVHPETKEERSSKKLEDLINEKEKYIEAIETIKMYTGKIPDEYIEFSDAELAAARSNVVIYHKKDIEKAKKDLELFELEKRLLQPWGDYDNKKLHTIEEHGIKLRFFAASKKDYEQYDFENEGVETIIVNRIKSTLYFVVIDRGDFKGIPFEEIAIPDKTLHELEADIENAQLRIDTFSEREEFSARYIPAFEKKMEELDEKIMLEKTGVSFDEHADGKVLFIEAWVPAKQEKEVVGYLEKEGITYSIDEPQNGDKVPVILKNGPFSKQFETITKIFQLPNYFEMDLTPVVAVFYPIFFGYCLGDMGYGLMIFVGSLIAMFTLLKKSKSVAILGSILGLFTMVMGLLNSGVLFGNYLIGGENPIFGSGGAVYNFLSNFIVIADTEANPTLGNDYFFSSFNMSLLAGVLQIHVGIILSLINKLRFESIADAIPVLGKLLLVPSLILWFLADMQNMEMLQVFSPYYYIGMGAGAFLILFLKDIRKGIDIGGGFLDLYFAITGLMGDVLSYVRLFALGISSFILGSVVNSIGGGFPIFIMIPFLIVGHSANLLLSALGSFVHPLRLTFVEFYNNVGFSGGGEEYKPLKKTAQEKKSAKTA